jgi:hypothetical protein
MTYIRRNISCWAALLSISVLAFLLFRFGRYFQNGSHDLVQHYMLVDELMKHGGVRADAFQRIGAMSFYPPATHWAAAIIGWIGGSGVVGIDIITIAAAFLSYLLLLHLVADRSPLAVVLFAIGFLLLKGTASLIGWEVVGNFFFPQLVGDAFYIATLILMARARQQWMQILAFVTVGTVTMWVQPLNAIHIIAAGCALLSLQALRSWREHGALPWRDTGRIFLVASISAAIVASHPAFRAMKLISYNDGSLGFGYVHILRINMLCGVVCAVNAWRYFRGKAPHLDAVLSAAGIAATSLVIVQFLALKLFGAGSDYAVKKHMFLVLTVALLNATRLCMTILRNLGERKSKWTVVAIPLVAGYMSRFALQGFTRPVAPTVHALAYADHAVAYGFPEFRPSNTSASLGSLPLISNVLISLSAFQHPFDDQARGWQRGKSLLEDMPYAMIENTPDVDRKCAVRFAETSEYVIVDPTCLKTYRIGETITFSSSGTGWSYLNHGWGAGEAWGTWAISNRDSESTLSLTLTPNADGPYQLVVDAMAFIAPSHQSQTIIVKANGTQIASWNFSASSPSGIRTASISSELIHEGKIQLSFSAPDGVSPKQLGISEDPRVLGIGLKSLLLR